MQNLPFGAVGRVGLLVGLLLAGRPGNLPTRLPAAAAKDSLRTQPAGTIGSVETPPSHHPRSLRRAARLAGKAKPALPLLPALP